MKHEVAPAAFEPARKAGEILDVINAMPRNEEHGFSRQYFDGMGQSWQLRSLMFSPRVQHLFLARSTDYEVSPDISLRHTFNIVTGLSDLSRVLDNIKASSWLSVSLVELDAAGNEIVTPIDNPGPALKIPVEINGITIDKHLDQFSDPQTFGRWSENLQAILEASQPLE